MTFYDVDLTCGEIKAHCGGVDQLLNMMKKIENLHRQNRASHAKDCPSCKTEDTDGILYHSFIVPFLDFEENLSDFSWVWLKGEIEEKYENIREKLVNIGEVEIYLSEL